MENKNAVNYDIDHIIKSGRNEELGEGFVYASNKKGHRANMRSLEDIILIDKGVSLKTYLDNQNAEIYVLKESLKLVLNEIKKYQRKGGKIFMIENAINWVMENYTSIINTVAVFYIALQGFVNKVKNNKLSLDYKNLHKGNSILNNSFTNTDGKNKQLTKI